MDDEQFDRFYEQSGPRLVGQLHALTGDRAEAADAVQEAFVRAWVRRDRLDLERDPEAWVRTTARRLAARRWRRAQFRLGVLRAQPPAPAAPEPSADVVVLVAALRRLPRAQREAVVLHHLVDLPVADVAAELGVSVGTVKSRLSRGRAALAAAVDGSAPAPDAAPRPAGRPARRPDLEARRDR